MIRNIFIILLMLVLLILVIYKSSENFESQKKKRILIIGNGPSLLEHKRGKEIDEFDIVVRFNTFKTDEYSEYVGTKTDIWFINGVNIRKKNPKIIKMMNEIDYKQIFIEQNNIDNKKSLLKNYPELKDNEKIEFCDLDEYNKIIDKFFKHSLKKPSLGVIGIYLISQIYNTYDIYITGFDGFDKKNIHYMDNTKGIGYTTLLTEILDIFRNKKKYGRVSAHSSRIEKKIISYLIDKHNIKKF